MKKIIIPQFLRKSLILLIGLFAISSLFLFNCKDPSDKVKGLNSSDEVKGSKKLTSCLFPIRQNNKSGFINDSGKIVLNPEFDGVGSFSEELAYVAVDGKYGFIDKQGAITINLQYDLVSEFKEGMARAAIGNKSGFIDKTGKIIIEFSKFNYGSDFNEGIAI
ncbi:MAG: WG repeat-containing protein [Saprospiraceae bacterium]|nr:WG repeat-containing protein [Saprospiraceae bacterium]